MRRARWIACIIVVLVWVMPPLMAQRVFIVEPTDGAQLKETKISVIVRGEPKQEVALFINGRKYKDAELRIDGKFDFLNVDVPPGPNHLSVEMLNSKGRRVYDKVVVYTIGAVENIELKLEPDEYISDGQGEGFLHYTLKDAWGNQVTTPLLMTLNIKGGKWSIDDQMTSIPGFQVRSFTGEGKVPFEVGEEPGELQIVARVNDRPDTIVAPIYKYLRDMIIVGYVGGEFGFNEYAPILDTLNVGPPYDDDYYMDSQGSCFLTGRVWNDFLFTARYDSRWTRRREVYHQFEPDKLYPLYGDNSSVFYEAQANSPVYMQLEYKDSYIMWGDYETDFRDNEFAYYNRKLTGLKSDFKMGGLCLKSFGTINETRAIVDTMRGEGISGYYYLTGDSIIDRSENIRLVTYDQYNTERVIRSERKERYTDYRMDYQEGRILFNHPVFRQDGEGNPIYIIATYEVENLDAQNYTAGLRGEVNLGDYFSLGGNIVNKQDNSARETVVGSDMGINYGSKFKLRAEAAMLDTGDQAYAYKVESEINPIKNINTEFYYRHVDPTFSNKFSPSVKPGQEKYGAKGRLTYKSSTLQGEYYNNTLTDFDEEFFASNFEQGYMGFKGNVGAQFIEQHKRAVLKSWMGTGRLEYSPTDRWSLFVARDHNFYDYYARPDANIAGGNLRISDKFSLFGKFYDTDIDGESKQLYTFGVRSNVLGTSAKNEYNLEGGSSDLKIKSILGLSSRVSITDALKMDVSYEESRALSGTTDKDFRAGSVALEYLLRDAKFNTKVEARRHNTHGDQLLFIAGGAFSVNRSFSMLMNDEFHIARDKNVSIKDFKSTQNKATLGFAFRPVSWDILNVISKFEHTLNVERSNLSWYERVYENKILGSLTGILSLSRSIDLSGRYAFKEVWEYWKTASDTGWNMQLSTYTDLLLGKVDLAFSTRADLTLEGRVRRQVEANDRRFGFSVEPGYVVYKDIRLGIGYNFFGFEDTDFADRNYWAKGPYLSVKVKFSEKGLEMPIN